MDDFERPNKEKRHKRRNYINKELRDLRGPFSPKMIPGKKVEYKREKYKDYNIENDEEE